jgi:Tol biopolymer transport system component
MLYRWLVVLGLAGCTVSPDPSLWKARSDALADSPAPVKDAKLSDSDSASDHDAVPVDGPAADLAADGSPKSCWANGPPTFSTPVAIDAVNSSATEIEPMLSPDGLTLYFASTRDGGFDVFLATRPSRGADFSGVQKHLEVSTADGESRFALSFDGLEAFLATDRSGGKGGADIWIATRSSTSTPFSPADFSPAASLNSSVNEWDPYPSLDGKSLYYAIQDWPSGQGSTDLVVATRSAAKGSFSSPAAVKGVNSASQDDNPALTGDELVILFGSTRAGGKGSLDIWYATRPDTASAFSTPKPLTALNTADKDSELYITPDGCELFFASDRSGGKGGWDIYRATASP